MYFTLLLLFYSNTTTSFLPFSDILQVISHVIHGGFSELPKLLCVHRAGCYREISQKQVGARLLWKIMGRTRKFFEKLIVDVLLCPLICTAASVVTIIKLSPLSTWGNFNELRTRFPIYRTKGGGGKKLTPCPSLELTKRNNDGFTQKIFVLNIKILQLRFQV